MLLTARPTMVAHGALSNPSLTTSATVTVSASSSSSSSTPPPPPPTSTVQRQRKPTVQRPQTIENVLQPDDQSAYRIQERMVAAQLAYMASQHHLSEYSRLKFGPAGCPAPYVPMSIQLRDQVKHLQVRQAIYSKQKAWWPSDGRAQQQPSSLAIASAPAPPSPSSSSQPLMMLQRAEVDARVESSHHQLPSMAMPQALNLQHELSAAMSSEMSTSSAVVFMHQFHVTKTSETHPINISMVIPFEFLPILQSQLSAASKSSPCLFHLPRNYHMDLATLIPLPGAHTCSSAYQFGGSNSNGRIPTRAQRLQQPVLQVQNGVVGFGRTHPFHPPPPVSWNQQSPSGEELLKMALDEDVDDCKKITSGDVTAGHSHSQSPIPPPPFVVPSQSHFAPPRVLTESPPVLVTPVSYQMPLPPTLSVVTPREMIENEKKEPSSGAIRRPRHERATSAPPSFGFGQGQTLREAGRALQRNKSNLDIPSAWTPSNDLASRPRTGDERSPKSLSIPGSSQVPNAGTMPPSGSHSASATNPPITPPSFETSLTENPAHLKPHPMHMSHSAPPILANGGHSVSTVGCYSSPCYVASSSPAVTKLGNLFLSSCPGKKVRLTGPVKGRGSVCRDLRQDLSRIRDLGVKCIICCLDDSELAYLGSPWSQYRALANELGLDVLRLPTPEGLHPLSAAQLDAELERVIREYTLQGTPVLAHCRGGVGRAGLVACCWMLKLGLCGWKERGVCRCPSCAPSVGGGALAKQEDAQNVMPVCYATVHLLEKVIGVVRRRRSLKAIETFEQVKFLVDYIEYLDAKSRAAGSSSSTSVEGQSR